MMKNGDMENKVENFNKYLAIKNMNTSAFIKLLTNNKLSSRPIGNSNFNKSTLLN